MQHKSSAISSMLMITLGIAIVSASVFFFMTPSNIPVGSVAGLALVIANIVPLSIATITFILNVSLLIVGLIFLGKEFAAKTVYTSIMMPAIMAALEMAFPGYTSVMGDGFLDMIIGLFIIAIGQVILFRYNASSGGLDVITRMMHRFLRMDMGKASSAVGVAAALTSVFFYDAKTVILAIFGTYVSGIILDHFLFGSTERKRVCIIAEKEAEITDYILHDLDAGATHYDAHGAYDGHIRREIITILDKSKYKQLLDFIGKVEPTAFITVTPIYEVYTPHITKTDRVRHH